MILQALTEYYKSLERQGDERYGWDIIGVSHAVYLNDKGEPESIVDIRQERTNGSKGGLMPQQMTVPARVKRTSGIAANFLCDNAAYIFGIDKDKKAKAKKCFASCKELHEELLTDLDIPAAKAVLAFFRTWNPDSADLYPALNDCMDDILSGGNIVFRYGGAYVHRDKAVEDAWNKYYVSGGIDNDIKQICLVTGEHSAIAQTHPSVKGIQGAQSSGAALVSFNAPAFCSYGKEQSLNAPTSKYAAFAYTAALNRLISKRKYRVGDATVVFWAKSGEEAYRDAFAAGTFEDTYEEDDLSRMTEEMCRGHDFEYEKTMLKRDMEFYVLGLSPNAARLSVRFFMRNSFGNFMRNLREHRERLLITRPAYVKFEVPSLKAILDSTVNQNSKKKEASPQMAGETLRAIMNNTCYPQTLLNAVTLRIRAEQRKITWERMALIKAYYLKNENKDVPKEVLTVSLNPDSKNIPYCLGRLFSVLEDIQEKANKNINSTIKDRYFNSASAMPATVFPTLINLAQKHLKKIEDGSRIYYNKQLQSIMDKLGEEYPARLCLAQQGAFQLGYYHQTQKRYEKRED